MSGIESRSGYPQIKSRSLPFAKRGPSGARLTNKAVNDPSQVFESSASTSVKVSSRAHILTPTVYGP